MEDTYSITNNPRTNAPWINLLNTLINVKIEYGVQNLPQNSFFYMSDLTPNVGYDKLKYVDISETVTYIGESVFDDDINLEDIEDEELREEIRLYKDVKRVNKEKINKD